MNRTFWTYATLQHDDWQVSCEVEELAVPLAYDGGGRPPTLRVVVLHKPSERIECTTLEHLRAIVTVEPFPLREICTRFPWEMVTMVTKLAEWRRPIRDDAIFAEIADRVGMPMKDLKPQVRNEMLQWHEYHSNPKHPIVQRRLCLNTFALVE